MTAERRPQNDNRTGERRSGGDRPQGGFRSGERSDRPQGGFRSGDRGDRPQGGFRSNDRPQGDFRSNDRNRGMNNNNNRPQQNKPAKPQKPAAAPRQASAINPELDENVNGKMIRHVDMRAANVELDKYNERYENIAPTNLAKRGCGLCPRNVRREEQTDQLVEEMVARVETLEKECSGYKDFHARRLVETAGHIIIYLLARQAGESAKSSIPRDIL